VTQNDIDAPFPTALTGEWIVVGREDLVSRGPAIVHLAERHLCLWQDDSGSLQARFGDVVDDPDPRIHLQKAYGFAWVCIGTPKRPLFLLPEYDASDGRIVHCGAIGVNTSPLRAVENFLDMGHFPYVHTDILGAEPHTEVKDYQVRHDEAVDELWALQCRFPQPKAAPSAASVQETIYRYRVVAPINVLLYKNPPAGYAGDDVICLFAQPLSEESIRGHMLMVLKDPTSTMTDMIAFQQMIFGQDKPILENHVPRRLPLGSLAEKSARADAMAMAYRRWLIGKGWTYGALTPNASNNVRQVP
jgi:phenylpropionate dioxygenase-like ring-hydroxylating dioxygenase large terminal subunit